MDPPQVDDLGIPWNKQHYMSFSRGAAPCLINYKFKSTPTNYIIDTVYIAAAHSHPFLLFFTIVAFGPYNPSAIKSSFDLCKHTIRPIQLDWNSQTMYL